MINDLNYLFIMKYYLLIFLLSIIDCAVYPYDGLDRFDDFFNGEYAN